MLAYLILGTELEGEIEQAEKREELTHTIKHLLHAIKTFLQATPLQGVTDK